VLQIRHGLWYSLDLQLWSLLEQSLPGLQSGQGRGANVPDPLHWGGYHPGTTGSVLSTPSLVSRTPGGPEMRRELGSGARPSSTSLAEGSMVYG